MINTIYCWAIFSLFTVIFGVIGLIVSLLNPARVVKYAMRPWGYCIIKALGIEVKIEGLDNLPDEPCVIMYNHQSSIDIPFFCGFLPMEWRAVMKDEVVKIPFVGWVTKLAGHYFVARDSSKRDTEEVKRIAKEIRNGPSVLIAPEGTRSPDGKLLPFKKGGFVIALLARVPVVPMVLKGGKDIMPRGSLRIKPGIMQMKILPPINISNFPHGKSGREKLENVVRQSMERELVDNAKLKIAS